MWAAFALEAGWDKHRILETYLNLVSFRGELQGDAMGSWLLAALLGTPNATAELSTASNHATTAHVLQTIRVIDHPPVQGYSPTVSKEPFEFPSAASGRRQMPDQTSLDNARNDSASGPYKVNSLRIDPRPDPMKGSVTWDPWRSIWNSGMLLTTLKLGPIYFSWSAFVVFIVLLALTMCLGHSVGFHRRLIHRTFQCPKWVERTLVWMGTLVGMQSPFWVIQSHDFRGWAQRQPDCHPYLRHGQGMIKDAVWNCIAA